MFREMLGNGLLMRTLQSEADRAAFVAFNARYNNLSEGATCQCLIDHHPRMHDDDFFIVGDERNHQVVACLCLIPWKMQFEGISLDAAMMEMVLSHPEYRRMGLIRKLIRKFQEEVGNRGFDLTLIMGIPYYYRQFGYAYALDLGEGVNLSIGKFPEVGGNGTPSAGLSFRKASISDIPVLHALHSESLKGLQLFFDRDDKVRQVAMEWGCITLNNDQWLLKAEDQVTLLTKLVPAFDRRIGESFMPGLTKEIIINQFRQAIGISIV